ncbi:uncharacterized protein LOC144173993 isoform X2 [Haemaphysalis longicornis]
MAPASVFMLAVFMVTVKAETLAPRTFGFHHGHGHHGHHGHHHHHAQTVHAHGGHGAGIPTHGHNHHALSAHGPHAGHAHQNPGYHHQQHGVPGQPHVVGSNVHPHTHQGPAHPHQHHVLPGHQHHVGSLEHVHAHQGPAHPHLQDVLIGHQQQVGGNHHGHNHSHSSGSPVTAAPASSSGRPATILICRVVEVTATPAVPAASQSGGGSFAHHHVFTNFSASLKAVVGRVTHPVVALLYNASTWLNRTTHGGHGHHTHQHFSGVPVARIVHNKIMALLNRHNLVPGTRPPAVSDTFTPGAPNHTIASSLAASEPTSRGSDAAATRAITSSALSSTTSPAHSANREITLPFGAVTLGKPSAVFTDVSMATHLPSRVIVSVKSGQVFTTEASNSPLPAANVSTRATTLIEPTYTTGGVTWTVTENTSPTSGQHRSNATRFAPTLFATSTRRLVMPTGQPSASTRPVPNIIRDVTLRPFQR